ncbi:MAG: hypothetical protein HN999_02290 [Candidatus Marinimicrobia bacterium]|jgi:hypothetical protein|nr:hypothetical protein [Candidatus Neomarinimicrobiota bacterium]MBT6942018.1 hypothetical protein [Candidatus Neomarinimicrobiota bacterium]
MTQLQVIKKQPMMSIGCLILGGLIVASDYFGWVNWNNNHAYVAAMVFCGIALYVSLKGNK